MNSGVLLCESVILVGWSQLTYPAVLDVLTAAASVSSGVQLVSELSPRTPFCMITLTGLTCSI